MTRNGKNKQQKSAAPAAKRRAPRRRRNRGPGQRESRVVLSHALRGQPVGAAQVSGNPYAKGGTVRIKHREYLGEMSGSFENFLLRKFEINPGLAGTFPWLSGIATQFEQYKFHKLEFSYATERPTLTPGYVIQVVDYDPADAPPANKQQIAMYQGSTRCPVYENMVFKADPKQLNREKLLYLRYGSLADNLDIKTYDSGQYLIATGGVGDTDLIGELWVDYDVDLVAPQFQPVERVNASSAIMNFGGLDPGLPFVGLTLKSGGLPIRAHTNGSAFIIDAVGEYLVYFTLLAGNWTAVAPAVSVGTLSVTASTVGHDSVKFNGTLGDFADYCLAVRVSEVNLLSEEHYIQVSWAPCVISGYTSMQVRAVAAPYDLMLLLP